MVHLRTGILQEGRQSERVHPLIHAFTVLRSKVVSPHVRVLSLEGELPVDLVFGSANGNPIRRQEYRPQEFLFLWTYGEVRIKISIARRIELADEPTRRGRGKMEALFRTCIIKRRALYSRFEYRWAPRPRQPWKMVKTKKEGTPRKKRGIRKSHR